MDRILSKLLTGGRLDREESRTLFDAVIRGEAGDVEIAALLVAMKLRGETSEEIAGAAQALREGAREFPRPDYRFADIVGTGGDGSSTINISTAAAFVAAEAGLPVAKHGNRAASSRCGAADLLERFGVKLDMEPATARKLLDDIGVTFLFAPHYHKGIRHAMPVRKVLATRTMFNLLGPLVNPARPPIMLVGVYDYTLCTLVADTLKLLGCERALVVNGLGLDEIAVHGETNAAELRADGEITTHHFTTNDFGVRKFPLSSIVGGSPEENEEAIRSVLGGRGDEAHAAAISVNAGALLALGGQVDSFKHGFELSMSIIESGKALERLQTMARLSQQLEEGMEKPHGDLHASSR
ncbi:MAG: anthranilate phosphoribosyltransferase [Burkholderiales bacterium]|jgi:anthranilate phosphoribosyltransferase|nr:anthranilate phosphoribosyltransferase [Burkholderiales bacterium]